jgi:hypothetical protein
MFNFTSVPFPTNLGKAPAPARANERHQPTTVVLARNVINLIYG